MGMVTIKMINKKTATIICQEKAALPPRLLKRDFLAVQQVFPQSVNINPKIYLEESLFSLTVP